MTDLKTATITRGRVTVTFVNLGEGNNGDYDPNDPSDENLLRIDVLLDGEQVDDGSYCTFVGAATPVAEQERLLNMTINYMLAAFLLGRSPKRTFEILSWLTPGQDLPDDPGGVFS